MEDKIEVSVDKHTWLDYSVSWFVKVNGVRSGGECTSEKQAQEIAIELAKNIGGEYIGKNNTNELFS